MLPSPLRRRAYSRIDPGEGENDVFPDNRLGEEIKNEEINVLVNPPAAANNNDIHKVLSHYLTSELENIGTDITHLEIAEGFLFTRKIFVTSHPDQTVDHRVFHKDEFDIKIVLIESVYDLAAYKFIRSNGKWSKSYFYFLLIVGFQYYAMIRLLLETQHIYHHSDIDENEMILWDLISFLTIFPLCSLDNMCWVSKKIIFSALMSIEDNVTWVSASRYSKWLFFGVLILDAVLYLLSLFTSIYILLIEDTFYGKFSSLFAITFILSIDECFAKFHHHKIYLVVERFPPADKEKFRKKKRYAIVLFYVISVLMGFSFFISQYPKSDSST